MAFVLRNDKKENTEFWLETTDDGGIMLSCGKVGDDGDGSLDILAITSAGELHLIERFGLRTRGLAYGDGEFILTSREGDDD